MSYTNDNKLVGDIRDVFKPDQERWDRHELEIISDINDEYLRKSRKVDEFYDELKKKFADSKIIIVCSKLNSKILDNVDYIDEKIILGYIISVNVYIINIKIQM